MSPVLKENILVAFFKELEDSKLTLQKYIMFPKDLGVTEYLVFFSKR